MSDKQIHSKRKAPRSAWKPGQSGNPNGRPKSGHAIPDILKDIGDEIIVTKEGVEMTKREVVLRSVYSRAVKGENWAVQFIADRTEGKAIERILSRDSDRDEIIIE